MKWAAIGFLAGLLGAATANLLERPEYDRGFEAGYQVGRELGYDQGIRVGGSLELDPFIGLEE